jgi:thiol-disulfide isomerase/thioredoxin
MRIPLSAVAILLLGAAGVAAQTAPSASQMLTAAQARATAEHKAIFLHFGASWCGWCRRLDAFLSAKEIRPLLERHFVLTALDVQESGEKQSLENPGAAAMLGRLGGTGQGLPYFVFLDANGEAIATSKCPTAAKPAGENIGYPGEQEEIALFLALLRKAAPEFTIDELKTIEHWLARPYIMDGTGSFR